MVDRILLYINQCKASVEYFSILHAVKQTYRTENPCTLTLKVNIKCHSMLRHSLRQITMSHSNWHLSCDRVIVQCENNFTQTIKQLLHQHRNIPVLASCNIKGELAKLVLLECCTH